MPAQGSDHTAHEKRSQLVETLRWDAVNGYWQAQEHLHRMGASAAHMGYAWDLNAFECALAHAADKTDGRPRRVRLTLDPDGTINLSSTVFTPPPAGEMWTATIASERVYSYWPWLRHKTSPHPIYERYRTARRPGSSETIFLNEDGFVCEGSRTNIFLRDGRHLLTPPVSCGLLPGVYRGRLIRQGCAIEHRLLPGDLIQARWYLGNSVVGLVRATLRAPERYEKTA